MAAAEAATPDSATAGSTSRQRHFFRIRLAVASDVPHIHKLIHRMSEFENLATDQQYSITESELSGSLFSSAPFVSVTVFILEASPNPFPESSPHNGNPNYTPVVRIVDREVPLEDPESEIFKTEGEIDVTVGGYALFYPNFPPYWGKKWLYLEQLYVRECYRGNGMGKMLLAAVAEQAVEIDCCNMNWMVDDWNAKAIGFYEGIGAQIVPGFTSCRLAGHDLHAFVEANGDVCGAFVCDGVLSEEGVGENVGGGADGKGGLL